LNTLPEADEQKAFELYSELYSKALPHAGELAPGDLEIADLGIAENFDEFKKLGVALKVVSNYSADYNRALVGHTGKVLLNLPFQLLPEHQHVDVDVLANGSAVPDGYTLVRDMVNGFEGIYSYNPDGSVKEEHGKPVFRFRDSENVIVQSMSFRSRLKSAPLFHFEGKSETFKMIYGDGVLLADDAKVLSSPVDHFTIPDRFHNRIAKVRAGEKITTKSMIYMAPGSEVLLPKHTKHALVAGEEGAVYLEFSTPSLDEADVFTDKRVIR
jgi:hypothetical protein